MKKKIAETDVVYVTKDHDLYKCMVCGKLYETSKPLPTRPFADGCCTIGSLIEIKEDEESTNV